MSDAQLIAMAKRNLAHVKAKTVDQAPDVYRVPAANYYDPERFSLEMERIFKRLPLVLGFSAELREPGSYRALLAGDIPVLLTRASDGELRGFLNVCSSSRAPLRTSRSRSRTSSPRRSRTPNDRSRSTR